MASVPSQKSEDATERVPTFSRSIFQKSNHRRRHELFAAVQKFQLDQKDCFKQFAAHFFDQCRRGGRCSASRQQIIDQNNSLPARDRVDMQFHFRFAVLKRVFGTLGFVRQSPFFPERNKADAEFIRYDRSEKKSAGIDPNDLVDLSATATFEKNVD